MRSWLLVALLLAAAAVGGASYARWRNAVPVAAVTPAPVAQQCQMAIIEGEHPGMVWVPGGSFTMGSDHAFPEEGPAIAASAPGFWMDQTEVTNAQFAQFVAATGYRTLAERGMRQGDAPDSPVVPGSAVFRPRGGAEAMRSFVNWWQFEAGANWRHPDGPGTSIDGLEQHPVVHIAYEDALAYAQWKGHSLPTEEQFEFAAQGGARKNAAGEYAANSWQGMFPSLNTAADGYSGTAPVGLLRRQSVRAARSHRQCVGMDAESLLRTA